MRSFKNFKGSDSRCPSIHFLFYAIIVADGDDYNDGNDNDDDDGDDILR